MSDAATTNGRPATLRQRVLRATRQAETWRLNDGQARMLNALAAHSDDDGRVRASVSTLAKEDGRAPRTGDLLLSQLTQLGIVSTRRCGRGVAERVLNFDAVPSQQLGLFEAPEQGRERRPNPQSATRSATPQSATAACIQSATQVASEGREGFNRGEDAREPESSSVTALASTLQEVLDILATGKPGTLAIEPLAINAALRAYAEDRGHDHRQAAHEVVSWTWDALGPPGTASANRLLMSALRKQVPSAGRLSFDRVPRRRFERPVAAVAAGGGEDRDFGRFSRRAGW